ncbi:uncharacterized protein K444DRAFT_540651 [Hyaloscypha bicolor E]|uniref:Thioredoxin domain-containing protein n=1 Tax=Hyaloscypha bicolor E TaxID=1095630 RepID=A0A2J6SU02_9HELO|nr:uncharacterized protein K444DRAFT_540651 [Hyaloscypha bicolor E]PMD54242.1 hypothetical protein K444DRAFT_540651 [Hyaloscypha bicolor E]
MAAPIRQFSATKQNKAKNRIFTSVRRPDDFSTYLLLSTSSRKPLITFWTASYCNTCRIVSPLLQELISSGVGEAEGAVSFAEIEFDSQDIMDSGLAMTYMITSIPTLLSFERGEAQTYTKVTDPKLMRDREWLKEWIRTEAGRGGGAGLNAGGGIFGGLWGNSK